MALNLKRKRAKRDGPRKTRKVDDELSDLDSDVQGSDVASQVDDDDNLGVVGIEGEEEEENDEEGEDWEGINLEPTNQATEDGHHHPGPGTKPKKPPTGEELRLIKDATDLFRSSSFKLQIDALLPNVRPKASRIPPLERFLFSLHAVIMGIPPLAPQHPLEASRKLLKKDISVPYPLPLPTEDTNWKVAFERPSDITVVGSWPNKVSVKAKDGHRFGVDVAVEMPDNLFQEKDYLNGRFFHKRAFYLANIALAIKNSKSKLNVDVLYDSLSDDPRLTKLVIIPIKDDSQNDFTKLNAQVCIIPVLSSHSPIPLHRLSPSHSNIRINSKTTTNNNEEEEDNLQTPATATPIYNTALLQSLTPKPQLLATHDLKEESPAFGDALTLLRVWANQRGYGFGSNKMCVRGFEARGFWWSALLGLLVVGEEHSGVGKSTRRKPLGRGLSSYQLFRAALDFLSKHDFERDPVFMKTKEGRHRYDPREYQGYHEAVFIDSSSTANLLSGVPLGSLELLRHDAIKTLETLDQPTISGDPFTQVFLTDQRDLPARFDTILRIDLSTAKPRSIAIHATMDTGSPANALMASLSTLLRQGLGDRTKAAAILHPASTPRPLSQAHPSNPNIIYIGLIHNPSNAFRLVDHGPAAAADEQDQSMIQKFRHLWGPKAELRRFKDGRIVESVVWEVKTTDERAHIPGMIVRHLLQHHFGIGESGGGGGGGVQTWQPSFDALLRLPEAISSMYRDSGVATGFKGAMTAFDDLVRRIKGLGDALPLAVLSVSPVSEQLRYTSVFSPIPHPPSLVSALLPPTAMYQSPISVILEFEKSSRWPDDLKAIQKMKLAFFERIASVLMSSMEGLRARVVVGDGVNTSEVMDQASLEIVTLEGWAFSVRIWNEREGVLLDRIIAGKTKHGHREAVEAKEVYTRRFIEAPRHHRAIATLCHQYSGFAGTVRLVKRWLASHWLLDGHVSGEVVELLCAKFFVGDGPGSRERGFASVVEFLKEEGVFDIPDALVAHRITALANATWEYLQGIPINVKPMFIHPTSDYDVIVRLDPAVLPRYFHNIAVDTDILCCRRHDQIQHVRPGFDPAQLLFCHLQIFYDSFGGDRFGIVWDPSLKQPRPFRVLGQFSSVPVKKGLVVLNENSVLSEIERLGAGLVKEIIVHV